VPPVSGASTEIQVLASAVGCKEVLEDLRRILDSRHALRLEGSTIQHACQLFIRGEANSHLGCFQKSISALYLARKYEEIENFMKGRRAKSTTGRSRDSLIYDQLLAEFPNPSSADRSRLRSMRREGLQLLRLEKLSGSNYPVWMLFPMRRMSCSDDSNKILTFQRYVTSRLFVGFKLTQFMIVISSFRVKNSHA
jgi:hypothetical protein